MWTNWLVELVGRSWEILSELAPWFLLGSTVAGLVHGLAFVSFVKQRLNGYRGVWLASLFGLPLPLCSCAVIPTGIGLRKSGASEGASIGFLIATPQVGIDSILVTSALLGWQFAAFKVVVALILGNLAGMIVEFRERCRQRREVEAVTPAPAKRSLSLPVLQPPASPAPTEKFEPAAAWVVLVGRYLRNSFWQSVEIIRSIYLWILVGVLLSAALTTWLPMGSIQSWLGPGRSWLQTPLALLISLPLYVCATASVPVAAALVHGGLSVGAAIVFLMAGPATNVATIGAIYRSFSRGAFVTYLATLIFGSVVAAWVFDGWFVEHGFVESGLGPGGGSIAEIPGHAGHAHAGHDHAGHDHAGQHAVGHDHGHWMNQVSAAGLLALFAWFAAQRAWRWWGGQREAGHQHG